MERKLPELNLGLGEASTSWLQDFIQELTERLEKMDKVLVVDRIEGDIAVCENRRNKKMENLSLSSLPNEVKEGSILKWKNNRYEIDTSQEIEDRITQKMKKVWKD